MFENVGTWQRARYFPRPGETMHQAVAHECRAVRKAAGIFDGSTLGKIEVVGTDAGEFLNRIYTGSLDRLAPGRCRYGVMLNEAGYVMDDGVIARLAPDRFHITTTTGGAASVLSHMEDYLQTEFAELRVWLTSTTEQWAVIAVQGPLARQVIAPLVTGIDLGAGAMTHMSALQGRVCDVPARLFRVSFTGELGYEINVPADYGEPVWEAVLAAGQEYGIAPYGTETMHVLRAEKGYIIVGQETDGTVIPADLGLGWTVGRTKLDFVGKRSLSRSDMVRPDRKQLVGIFSPEILEEGAQIVSSSNEPALGHVTSAYWSEVLQRPIALALVSGGRARLGQTLYVPLAGRTVAVRVTDPVFYDKDGEHLHG
jgi:sarcosine oxidase subunit alpha